MTNYNPFGKELENLVKKDLDILRDEKVAEGWFIEYKGDFPSNKKIGHSIASFANSDGGWFIIGVEAEKLSNIPKTMDGIDLTVHKTPKDKIRSIITNHIGPTPFFESKLIKLSDVRGVLVVHVDRGDESPYVTNDGKIYQRIGEGSDPVAIKDHYTIQKLYDRSKEAKLQIEEFSRNSFSLSVNQSQKQGFLECYFFIPPSIKFEFDNFYSDEFFMEARENFINPVEIVEGMCSMGLNFNNFYSSVFSYIIRKLDNPEYLDFLGLTIELLGNGNLKMLFPIPEFTFANLEETLPKEYIDSQYLNEFIELFPPKYEEIRFIDGFKFFIVFMTIIDQYFRILKKYNFTENLKFRFKLVNCDRTLIYFDSENYINFIKKQGFPICLKQNMEIPPFHNGNSMNINSLDEVSGSYLFSFIGEGLGIPFNDMIRMLDRIGHYLLLFVKGQKESE